MADHNGGNDGWREDLRRARKRLKLTQTELAERTGISAHTIRAYEGGKRRPSRAQLEKVFATLKVPNADANRIREGAGYAPVRSMFLAEYDRGYFYNADELQGTVETVPWPEFVLNDPLERHNLAGREEHKQTLAALRTRWRQMRRRQ